MQQDNTNSEEIKQSYFQIKSSAVEHLRDLVHDLKSNKNLDLQDKIKELEEELENLKNTKKYWLVWDNEKEPEQVVLDCQNKLPILKEKKDKKILNDDSWESNILIEWDNYHALQVLSYTHKEAIDVIYIDPPYNTWNKDFIYNDKYIDKEDTYRHSKWLNFMSKRLNLAYDLLKEEWVIFISIDDNEQAQLKLLCDEIFWEENFIIPLYIQVRYPWKTLVEDSFAQKIIETVYVYWKSNLSKLEKEKENYSYDKFEWQIKELWIPESITLWNKKVEIFKEWTYEFIKVEWWKNNFKEIWASWKVLDWNSSGRFFRDYLQWREQIDWFKNLYKVYWIGDDQYDFRYFTWPKKEWATKWKYYQWVPMNVLENFENHQKEISITNFHNFADSFWNCRLEGNVDFRNWKKPIKFLKFLLNLFPKKDNLKFLDFFAGSWSLWHAVIDMNLDWLNRSFILCTNNESNICENITYQRILNVLKDFDRWNLRYYETDFVEVDNLTDIDDEKKLELTYNAWELLAIKEWIYNELEKNSYWQIFENRTDIVAVYFKETATNIDEMEERLTQIQKQKWWKVIWYIYWNPYKKETFKKIKNLELKDIPDPILKVYREINKV